MKEVIVKDSDLRRAAREGMDAFLKVVHDGRMDAIGGGGGGEARRGVNSGEKKTGG